MDLLGQLMVRIASMGPWAPVLFILAYVLATIVLAPAFLLTVAAGAVFGFWRGMLLAYLGTLLGASAVFWLASPLAQSRMLHWLYRDRRVSAVRRAVVHDGLWVMFLLRLSPVVPFVLLNYGLALSGVRYSHFVLAFVGMLPTIVVYVYYGKVVGDVAKVAAGVTPPRGPGYYALLTIGLVATVLATRSIARASRRAIQNANDGNERV